ncbi:uncharacterized protein LOC110887709 [Helianthus annuus]|uniref:uncharacterized protein LOC110887709 n=1 Tax=Helianthus annuus TaxID=4232 RepID=UPI000B8F5E7E|nr:uncharacterized protein LOC110887709 [Helianthus annuus]
MSALLSGVNYRAGPDRWLWSLNPTGEFSVVSIKDVAAIYGRSAPAYSFFWNNFVPKKVGIVSWRVIMERLPTRAALVARNIDIGDPSCPFCGEYDETCDHIFAACHFAQVVWLVIAQWCKIPPIIAFGLKDLLDAHVAVVGSKKKKKVFSAIFQVVIWSIWKMRNEVIFGNEYPNISKVVDESKSMSFLWIKYQLKSLDWTWNEWRNFRIAM